MTGPRRDDADIPPDLAVRRPEPHRAFQEGEQPREELLPGRGVEVEVLGDLTMYPLPEGTKPIGLLAFVKLEEPDGGVG